MWGGPYQVRLTVAKSPLYPLMFQPRFKERVWGGRTLETLYGKSLPPAGADRRVVGNRRPARR